MLAHVVYAQDRRAALVCHHGRGDARAHRTGRRRWIADDLAERALARKPDEQRTAEREQDVEPPQELEVVLQRLAESDSGVKADPVFADAARNREPEPLLEERR